MRIEKLTLPIDYKLLNSYEKLDVVLNHAENVKFTSQFLINVMDLRSNILFHLENKICPICLFILPQPPDAHPSVC